MSAVVLIALGAAVGAPLRFVLDRALPRRSVPWGIVVANAVGSLTLGVVSAAAASSLALLVGTGFCGALTTMSGLALDTCTLAGQRRWSAAAANVVVTLAVGLAAALAGVAIGRAL